MAEAESHMPKLINLLASLLQRVAEENDVLGCGTGQGISVFHGLTRPNISVQNYLERLFTYANCSPSCFIVAYIYLDRFSRKQPLLQINSFNVHRLIIASLLVATKFMDDIFYNNAYYAKVGGISTTEMNLLEVDFLFALGFQLNVTPTTFYTYFSYLHREMLLSSPPPDLAPSSLDTSARAKMLHHCIGEDESNHQQQFAF